MVESIRVTIGPATQLVYEHPDTTGGDVSTDVTRKSVLMINVSQAPGIVYVGGGNFLTTASGARWLPSVGRTLSIDLEPGEAVYAVCFDDGNPQDIDVLVNGR